MLSVRHGKPINFLPQATHCAVFHPLLHSIISLCTEETNQTSRGHIDTHTPTNRTHNTQSIGNTQKRFTNRDMQKNAKANIYIRFDSLHIQSLEEAYRKASHQSRHTNTQKHTATETHGNRPHAECLRVAQSKQIKKISGFKYSFEGQLGEWGEELRDGKERS